MRAGCAARYHLVDTVNEDTTVSLKLARKIPELQSKLALMSAAVSFAHALPGCAAPVVAEKEGMGEGGKYFPGKGAEKVSLLAIAVAGMVWMLNQR